jgi:phage baseplate assembly protein W
MGVLDRKNDFLGRGWSFPPTFDRRSGQVVMAEYEQDVEQSLHVLFSTSLRERILLPGYGCTLQDHVFDPIDATLFTHLQDLIGRAILYFEPRIVVDAIEVEADKDNSGQVNILLAYTVRQTNTRSNIVYPFYLAEATIVRQRGQP